MESLLETSIYTFTQTLAIEAARDDLMGDEREEQAQKTRDKVAAEGDKTTAEGARTTYESGHSGSKAAWESGGSLNESGAQTDLDGWNETNDYATNYQGAVDDLNEAQSYSDTWGAYDSYQQAELDHQNGVIDDQAWQTAQGNWQSSQPDATIRTWYETQDPSNQQDVKDAFSLSTKETRVTKL